MIVIKITEDGDVILKRVAKTKRKLSAVDVDEHEFECGYCGNYEESLSLGSSGPHKWVGSLPLNASYTLDKGGFPHKDSCNCPVNPHSHLLDVDCTSGHSSCDHKYRGSMFFVKHVNSDNGGRIIADCDEQDLSSFKQFGLVNVDKVSWWTYITTLPYILYYYIS